MSAPKDAVAKIDALIEENADYFSGWREAHLGEPSTHGKWKARALAAETALEAAQAENAKLREALKTIREAWPKASLGPVQMPPFHEQVRMFADINALLEPSRD